MYGFDPVEIQKDGHRDLFLWREGAGSLDGARVGKQRCALAPAVCRRPLSHQVPDEVVFDCCVHAHIEGGGEEGGTASNAFPSSYKPSTVTSGMSPREDKIVPSLPVVLTPLFPGIIHLKYGPRPILQEVMRPSSGERLEMPDVESIGDVGTITTLSQDKIHVAVPTLHNRCYGAPLKMCFAYLLRGRFLERYMGAPPDARCLRVWLIIQWPYSRDSTGHRVLKPSLILGPKRGPPFLSNSTSVAAKPYLATEWGKKRCAGALIS
uniref:Uncharacterized protein n=1 Tax=Timema shepardi TaxID=629360 RepID=A0A7R9APS2_TIMSH|nr:unnamed protein product [Timema shepardi]